MKSRFFLCFLGSLGMPWTTAHAGGQTQELKPVVITETRLERNLADVPVAITVVDAQRTQQGQQNLQLDESLARVPGLYLQNRYNFAQNLRLSSRGFGSRAPFGIRGLRVNVDGFPTTLPDGQSQVDSIDLDSLRSITVLRGPASVFHGNATGGVVDIHTLSGRDLQYAQKLEISAGADGYRKVNLHAGGNEGRTHHYVSLSGLDYEGYREHSATRKYLFNSRFGYAFSPQRDLELFFTAVDFPKAEDPGGLTRTQAREDRRQANRFSTLLDAGQEVTQQRLGLLYQDRSLGDGLLKARFFVSQRDFMQQMPFPGSSRIDYERLFYGTRLEYSNQFDWLGVAHRYVVGTDLDRQQDDRGRNSVDTSGQITGLTANEDQVATASGWFAQSDSQLSEDVTLSLGLRADSVRMRIDDDLLADGDDSGHRRFTETSYSVGLTWHPLQHHTFYATVSNAFETPTFTELANPNGSGGFNPDLSAQKALNREVGLRGQISNRMLYSLALFSVKVRDEITPFEIAGRTFYDNAARTRRDGVELSLEHHTSEQLTLTLAWTWADYRFDDFYDQQQGERVDGNRLPGLPRHHLFAEAAWRSGDGLFAIADASYTSAVYAENTNTTRVGSYALVNLRAGQRWRFGARALDVYAGLHNLLDRDYFSNIRINANSDRPTEQRGYFEPGPGRAFYAGVALSW